MIDCVLTLIARPGDSDLAAALKLCGDAFPGARADWLAKDVAIDLFIAAESATALRDQARTLIGRYAVDLVAQPAAEREKKLLIADMDSTMIGQECIDELADFAGVKAKVAGITARAMAGELDFAAALRERVGLLAGLPEDTIDRVIAERITITPGARTLIATMRANGAQTILVSGGFTAFTDRVARMIGFNENRANQLLFAHGRLTGKVAEPILGREAKLATLEDAIIRFNLKPEECLAIGDGANDLLMVRRAGLGVAYHAKPALAEVADARIDHADLTAVLYAQGYRPEEFVENG